MDAIVFLLIGAAVLCGIAYLIGHAHGHTAGVITGSTGSTGGTPTTSSKDDGNRPQDAQ